MKGFSPGWPRERKLGEVNVGPWRPPVVRHSITLSKKNTQTEGEESAENPYVTIFFFFSLEIYFCDCSASCFPSMTRKCHVTLLQPTHCNS